ncbi:MAG: hypothetical protein H0U45_15245 [Tatlockia sp.]|nr:hypothetical protein [Tatlockia sp.]
MQRLRGLSLNYILAGVGILLVAIAFIRAPFIPQQAEQDYQQKMQKEFERAGHSSIEIEPGEPIFYQQVSANSRMLQNGYLGATGIVMLAAGAFGAVLSHHK